MTVTYECEQSLPVRHTLDVMHMEKNVASTLMDFILGNSDTIAMRQDLEAEGIMHHLH